MICKQVSIIKYCVFLTKYINSVSVNPELGLDPCASGHPSTTWRWDYKVSEAAQSTTGYGAWLFCIGVGARKRNPDVLAVTGVFS